MSFTYQLGSSDAGVLLISKVRLEIGDITEGQGVMPSGANLSDEEINYFLGDNSDSVLLAAAAACDALSRHWASIADVSVGPRRESLSQVTRNYSQLAEKLRARAGGMVAGQGFSMSFDRSDGFSDNADGISTGGI